MNPFDVDLVQLTNNNTRLLLGCFNNKSQGHEPKGSSERSRMVHDKDLDTAAAT